MTHPARLVLCALATSLLLAACGATGGAPAPRAPIYAQTVWSRADGNPGVVYSLDSPLGPSALWIVSRSAGPGAR